MGYFFGDPTVIRDHFDGLTQRMIEEPVKKEMLGYCKGMGITFETDPELVKSFGLTEYDFK